MVVKKTPAKKARKGINPFTGEPTIFKAKPASRKVKVTVLKKVKEMVSNKKKEENFKITQPGMK